jgi:c-di-GMP-binding flagellar brake protein YcgR
MNADTPSVAASADDKFLIRNREEILLILTGFSLSRDTVSILFSEGHDILLSEVIAVLPENNALLLDPNSNADFNKRLLDALRLSFVVEQDGVTVRWTAPQAFADYYEGRPVFRVNIPETLRRIQRREYFRVATPSAHPLLCSVPSPGDPAVIVDFPLVDISMEGIGVILPAPEVMAIEKGAELPNCTINFGEAGSVAINLRVRNIWTVTLKNGKSRIHAGLGFVGLSTRTQSIIQHYVTHLDRLRIATRPRH